MKMPLALLVVLIVGGVYFGLPYVSGSQPSTPQLADTSSFDSHVVREGRLINLAAVNLTNFIPSQDWWLEIKSLWHRFFRALDEYVVALPKRVVTNWLEFLGLRKPPTGQAILPTHDSFSAKVQLEENQSTTTNERASTTPLGSDNLPLTNPNPNLDLVVGPKSGLTIQTLEERLRGSFSDTVDVTLYSNSSEGEVTPQFSDGAGKTYIFLLQKDPSSP